MRDRARGTGFRKDLVRFADRYSNGGASRRAATWLAAVASSFSVAELLDRHPSWVSRRLGLLERLVEQVQDDVRVGLVSTTAAREIAWFFPASQVF